MNILVIEDDADTRAYLCDILEGDGHCVETAGALAEVFQRGNLFTFPVILLARGLLDGTTDQNLPRLKRSSPDAAIVITTSYADLDGVTEVIRQGAVDFIIKPIHPDRLKLRLKRIVTLREAEGRISQVERLAAIGQMLTVLSHEGRNALQITNACLEALALEFGDHPVAADLMGAIKRAQDHLHQLFDDLRGYAAPIVMHRDKHNVSDIVLDAWNSLLALHKNRLVRLSGNKDAAPVYCEVDRPRLEQVFRNILENALAACADPVEIAWRLSEVDDEPAIRIVLEDNGPGLSDEQRQRIFDPFYTTKSHGTGLGVPICKQIVEAHGGKIAVENLPSRGARFVITLPTAELPRTVDETASPLNLAAGRLSRDRSLASQ